jgi:KDO2-lipid IV(A) lauroyltransferase
MKKRGKPFIRLRWLLEYLLTLLVLGFIRVLPFPVAVRFGGLLGGVAYKIDKRHQAITEENLRNSFNYIPADEVRDIAKSVYRNLGYSVVEFIRSARYGKGDFDSHFRIVNLETYKKAQERKKGVLLLTAHCGSWELLAMAAAILKPPIGVVVRPLDNPYLERAVSAIRTRYGNTLIGKTRGMREILKVLGDGGSVGILLDQNVKSSEGVFVDFFGRPACTNKGLALIASKTGAPVIPAFIRRVDRYSHEIVIGDEVPLSVTGDKEADILANTQAYTKAIEDFIRKYPDQWFWMHRRWKTRPWEGVDA